MKVKRRKKTKGKKGEPKLTRETKNKSINNFEHQPKWTRKKEITGDTPETRKGKGTKECRDDP